MKNKLMFGLGIVLMLLTWGLFLFSCLVIPTDAQGVFIFIVTLPIITLCLTFTYLISRNDFLKDVQVKILKHSSKISAILIISFFISAAVPVLNFYPKVIVETTSKTFEWTMGMTAKDWFKQRNAQK